ncbi:hypothetical protein EJB05_54786 [Eragrostis curvula]|uniref:Uncharacterized protein n=1 Tax=Eragrostis curvula TaxID=38414 RepID=A0A5J9SLI8_9POAL|nr:hypothetical protein EJB05_54786 [Eragrostis curvula]
MIEAGGVLDPFSGFIPMRISPASKQEYFFNSDSPAELRVSVANQMGMFKMLFPMLRPGPSL